MSIESFSTSIREAIRTRIRALRRQKVLEERERAAAISTADGQVHEKPKRRRRRSANDEELDDSELGEIRGTLAPSHFACIISIGTIEYRRT